MNTVMNFLVPWYAGKLPSGCTTSGFDESTTKMQRAADIATWTRKWCIKLNETKPTYNNFTNQKIDQRSILNGIRIPPANTAKYLGMTLDAKL
jgi:hypothetical protein